MRVQDCVLGTGAHARCHGKGRKERCTPLGRETVNVLRAWIKDAGAAPSDFLFPSRRGGRLSPDAVERLVAKHARPRPQDLRDARPQARHPARPAPHRRHDAPEAGVDTSVIALWLGHEGIETTQIYLHADMSIKEQALARVQQPGTSPGRYRPPDSLLAFLDNL